ncbi:hypothetical protein AB0D67_01395 [Streptosporangium sp. NPDC048047]|uniref:hypothetical protein n=1 Tax=Streptosporangium sp. NPDC048047 TaxID=3155748 RepID=UPI003424C52D
MSGSLTMPRFLLPAVLAAGLTACSAGGGTAAPPPSPAVSSPAAAESTPASEPSASASAEPTAPDDSGETDSPGKPTEDPGVAARDDDAGDAEPAVYLLGDLGLNAAQPDTLDVLTGAGDTQSVPLSPHAEVLDQRGRICDKGKAPHRCTVDQLKKALGARKAIRAKVTLRKGTAVLVEEVTGG